MLKNLKLDRPIAFIDVETTGLSPYSDRIVELSILKIHPDGNEEYKSHRINPEIPIPAETTAALVMLWAGKPGSFSGCKGGNYPDRF